MKRLQPQPKQSQRHAMKDGAATFKKGCSAWTGV
jgi:hypothetical protein